MERWPAKYRKTFQGLQIYLEQDPVYGPIFRDLEKYGYDLQFSFWGDAGEYKPDLVFVSGDYELSKLKAQHYGPARFHFSTRYGQATFAYTLLHELFHFFQDMQGMLYTPLLYAGQIPVLLSAESYVRLSFFFEAMATTEAIRVTYRLKQNGYDAPLNAGSLFRIYHETHEKTDEHEAARRVFLSWYSSGFRRFVYERRALKLWFETVKITQEKCGMDIKICDVDPQKLITSNKLPQTYLEDLKLPKFSLSRVTRKYDGQYQRVPIESFKHGSPVYLWRKYQC